MLSKYLKIIHRNCFGTLYVVFISHLKDFASGIFRNCGPSDTGNNKDGRKNVGLITADKQTSKKSKGMASISSITLLIASCQANAKKNKGESKQG